MGFFQKIIDDFGLGQHKVDEEALYAQIALFKDDLKAQEGKYTNQDEAIQFRDKWADLYKEAKAARLGKKSPLWEERKQFTDTFDRLAEVLTGYQTAYLESWEFRFLRPRSISWAWISSEKQRENARTCMKVLRIFVGTISRM